jgi:hypothetical protein
MAWDLSLAVGDRRHVVFELKAVEAYRGPYVPINEAQLTRYRDLNDRVGNLLAWYVLPTWGFDVPAGQLSPREASLRTYRAGDPRPAWRGGIRRPLPHSVPPLLPDLRDEMALGRGCESFFYLAEPDRIALSGRVRNFGGRHRTGIPVPEVVEVAEGMTLEHFMMLLGRGELGVAGWILEEVGDEGLREAFRVPLPEPNATVISV